LGLQASGSTALHEQARVRWERGGRRRWGIWLNRRSGAHRRRIRGRPCR